MTSEADREEPMEYRRRTERPKSLRVIDVFAGCGGMTLGFVRLSRGTFESVLANDNNEHAARTYNANFEDRCVVGDIVEILSRSDLPIPPADVVLGGPPCQGFSLLNRGRRRDPRNQLWQPFLEVVRRSGASCFVMENVPQLLGSPEHREIIAESMRMGFIAASAKLTAADYGVPQTRQRAFIIGCSFEDPARVFPPMKTHYDPRNGHERERAASDYVPDAQPWLTVRNAIGDLPRPEGCEIRDKPGPLDLHFGRNPTAKSRARYEAVPDEGMNRFDLQQRAPEITPRCWIRKKTGGTDLFGRLWWDRPAFTVRTEFFKPEKGRYLHPEQHRPITHREAARFQSFPDDFIFHGTKSEIAKQIGNAVPPVLAARIADAVYRLFTEREPA